jgi:hypothetical protein
MLSQTPRELATGILPIPVTTSDAEASSAGIEPASPVLKTNFIFAVTNLSQAWKHKIVTNVFHFKLALRTGDCFLGCQSTTTLYWVLYCLQPQTVLTAYGHVTNAAVNSAFAWRDPLPNLQLLYVRRIAILEPGFRHKQYTISNILFMASYKRRS